MKHKHAELIKAWADGAEIEQACRNGIGEILWYPFKGDWQEHYEYRIKPHPMRELTDEEISQVYKEVSEPFGEKRLYEIHDFARAILKKASE